MLARRQVLTAAVGAAAYAASSRFAVGQAYPSRPVHLIIGFAAGGPGDALLRLTGQRLSERLGRAFVVENRPGGGGNVATEAVVNAAPDGHTLLYVNPAQAINATLYPKLRFDFIRDIAPVAGLIRVPNVMVVHPSVPVTTVAEFVTHARAHPDRVSRAVGGIGTSGHLAGELFNMMTGVKTVLVPYRGGGPALADLLVGHVQVYFGPISAVIGHIREGRLRALAVTTAMRANELPDTPTIADTVPGYEASTFQGLGAPRGTPPAVIGTLNAEINRALTDPVFRTQLSELGGWTLPGSPADFGRLLVHETEKWAEVVKVAGLKPE